MASRGTLVSDFDRGKRLLLDATVDQFFEVAGVVEPSLNLLPSSARRDQYWSSSHISSRGRLSILNHLIWPSRPLTGIPSKVREGKTWTAQFGRSHLSNLRNNPSVS